MYRQNKRFSQMKDKKLGMKNSGRINKPGFNSGRMNKSGFNSGGINKSGFNSGGINKSGFNSGGINKSGFNSGGMNQSGFNSGGMNQSGFNSGGMNQSGFNSGGINQSGFNSGGINKSGFNSDGMNQSGFNSDGMNQSRFNSGGINQSGFNSDGNYSRGASVSDRGQMNKNVGNQPFVYQDVTKLKQLCTATNEWIQQKSSELLDVLRRTDGNGGDVCHRTVTVQSKMNFDNKPSAMFDRSYNDFQPNCNLSEVSNRDYLPVNASRTANMNYEQNRERSNQEERNWGFKPNQDMAMNQKSYQQEQPSNHFSVIQKMKMYLNNKPFSENKAAKLFLEAANFAGGAFNLSYIPANNKKQHRFNVSVENVLLAFGTSPATSDRRTLAKKNARTAAYMNALNRLNNSSVEEICNVVSSNKPAAAVNKFPTQAFVEPDPERHISALVIRETQKIANRREKNALPILRRSVYSSKMTMYREKSVVGNVHKSTIFVQNKPVGIGFSSTVTKAAMYAAADALFNNFYRNNPIIQVLDEDDMTTWINWTNIRYLANEMERIGGHSLIPGQNISSRSFATAIKKLVDTYPWTEVDNEMIFGPGMSKECVDAVTIIAKERNLNLEERKHSNYRSGPYYVLRRYYDPVHIVSYLKKNGGSKGKYRLVERSEIPQIQCDHWEPSSQVWNNDKESEEVPRSKGFDSKKQRMPRFPNTEANDRNVDNSSSRAGRAFNNSTFSNKQRLPINDRQQFPTMSDYKANEFEVSPHSKDQYLSLNTDGRFNQKFTRDTEMCGFNDGEFRQVSRSDNDFRPMSDSCDREPKQMSLAEDRGFWQMPQTNDRGFGQRHQPNSEEFEQSRWLDREFRQVRQSDDVEFGQMSRSDIKEPPSLSTWHDRREFKQELSCMPASHDREYRETSRSDSREFGRMQSLEEREFSQLRGHMERGMSDNFDNEFNPDKNQRLGHDERRFNAMHDYTGQDFNRTSDNKEREFNSQFRSNEGNTEQMYRTYDDNYKHLPDVNKERIGRNTYDNKHDKLSGPSDIGMHHSSTYDNRFNFDKPTPEPDNRHYNQLSLQKKRDYDNVSRVDDNRFYTQGPNYDDRRSRFNNEPQLSSMDRQNNQINQDNMMDTNRMQNNNGPWNKMQAPRGEDGNSRMYRQNNPMPCGPTQGNNNMMMQQSMMTVSQDVNKNQLTALRFLTKKIAHTALHANVKSILANARRLSNIARARSRMEKSTVQKAPVNTKKPGRVNEGKKRPLSETNPKAAYMLQISQNSKVIKKTNERQPAFNKSSNRRVSSQNKNAKQK